MAGSLDPCFYVRECCGADDFGRLPPLQARQNQFCSRPPLRRARLLLLMVKHVSRSHSSSTQQHHTTLPWRVACTCCCRPLLTKCTGSAPRFPFPRSNKLNMTLYLAGPSRSTCVVLARDELQSLCLVHEIYDEERETAWQARAKIGMVCRSTCCCCLRARRVPGSRNVLARALRRRRLSL